MRMYSLAGVHDRYRMALRRTLHVSTYPALKVFGNIEFLTKKSFMIGVRIF